MNKLCIGIFATILTISFGVKAENKWNNHKCPSVSAIVDGGLDRVEAGGFLGNIGIKLDSQYATEDHWSLALFGIEGESEEEVYNEGIKALQYLKLYTQEEKEGKFLCLYTSTINDKVTAWVFTPPVGNIDSIRKVSKFKLVK